MSRASFFLLGTLVLAFAAAGILVGTNVFDLRQLFGPSPEAELVTRMNDAAGAGISITFGQQDAEKWQIASGHRLERFSVDRGDASIARLSSTTPLDQESFEWPTQGLSVGLPREFGSRSNGRLIEIGVVARAAAGRSSATLSLVYATRQAGNSGWQKLHLDDHFELKTFKYAVPERPEGYTNPPVLVLNADASGGGGSVELLGVYLKILDNVDRP